MRVTTWNVNGLRAALRNGLPRFLRRVRPQVLLLQEIRVHPDQLDDAWRRPRRWKVAWNPGERKGYAGTAVFSRTPVQVLETGLDGADPDGRVLRVRTAGLQFVSVYLPSGSQGPERQRAKEAWMDRFLPWAGRLAASNEPVVLGGDLNIAHTALDIHNPGGNKKNSGFLPHERAWFSELLATGWSDPVREQAGEVVGPFSWWSNRGRARELDRGWRIDYLLVNRAARRFVGPATTLRAGGLEVSDHAPVSLDLDLDR